MAFVTEQEVRLEANLYNTEEAPSELIQNSLIKAHSDILAGTILSDESAVSGEIKCAEIRLAVSHLFRTIVISSAVSARDWRASGLRLDESGRLKNLACLSEELWEEAWMLLHPFLRCAAPDSILVVKGGSR